MAEAKKMNLKAVDTMLCWMMSEGVNVDQVDIFYRHNRDAELKALHTVHNDFLSMDQAIPDFILREYGKSPVGMFQVKYTGSGSLFGRIILDAERSRYVTPKQEKRKRVKGEYKRMKGILDNYNTPKREKWETAECIGTIVEE